ncbi:MAG: hypothetical protein WC045_00530 [Patescibacteria group bacterium]
MDMFIAGFLNTLPPEVKEAILHQARENNKGRVDITLVAWLTEHYHNLKQQQDSNQKALSRLTGPL